MARPNALTKWLGAHRFAVGTGILVLGVLASIPGRTACINHKVNVELDRIRAQGLPATPAELDAWYEDVPADRNAAVVLQGAFDQTIDATDWRKERSNELPIWEDTEPPLAVPLTAGMRGLLKEFLADNAESVALLHKGASMPQCRYDADLFQGQSAPLRHLSHLRLAVITLRCAALLNASDGKVDEALGDAVTSFRLARTLRDEPVVVSQLVRLDMVRESVHTLMQVMSRARLTDAQLVRLDAFLKETVDPAAVTRGYVGELCMMHPLLLGPPRMFAAMDGTPTWVLYAYRYSGSNHRDRLLYVRSMGRLIDASRLGERERLGTLRKLQTDLRPIVSQRYRRRGACFTLTNLARHEYSFFMTLAKVRLARTAVAIERYRQAEGKPPAYLVDLVPQYLPAVPVDPFNGKPVRCIVGDKECTLFSVCWAELSHEYDWPLVEPPEKGLTERKVQVRLVFPLSR